MLISTEEVIDFVKTKTKSIIKSCPDSQERKIYVATGLPLSTAKKIYAARDYFVSISQDLLDTNISTSSLIEFLQNLENWSRENAMAVVKNLPEQEIMDAVRTGWILGVTLRNVIHESTENTSIYDTVLRDVYGFQMPWLINAISQQIRLLGHENLAETLGRASLLVELGVPNDCAAWIFLAGIRSRTAATELSQILQADTLADMRRLLKDNHILHSLRDKTKLSENLIAWIDLLRDTAVNTKISKHEFPDIRCEKLQNHNTIIVRNIDDRTFLCTIDGKENFQVESNDRFPFDLIENQYRYSFNKNQDGIFRFTIRDPKSV